MANSDIKLRRKVRLRKKVEEPKVTVETEGAETGNTPIPDKSGSKKWPWILLGVIVVFVIGYFIFSKSGDTTVTASKQETEIVKDTIVLSDSVANQKEAIERVLPADKNELSNNVDGQEVKVNEAPVTTVNNSNIVTTAPSATSDDNISNDVEAEAMKVIRGDYGVGQERKEKLGTKYKIIQSRVNELKRKGIF